MRYLLLFLFVLIKIKSSVAQSIFFTNYNVEHGLSAVQITALHQDNKGYLWCGGYAGVDKFNGKTFKSFSPSNGLVDHNTQCIAEDKYNNVYMGTPNGLSVYNNNVFTNYTTAQGLLSNDVKTIIVSKSNVVLIGTSNGLCALDNVTHKITTVLKNEPILSACHHTGDTIMFSTNKAIYKWYGNQCKLFVTTPTAITHIKCINNNTQLMSDSKGLYMLTNGSIKPYVPEGITTSSIVINDLYIQNENEYYIATQNGLIKITNNAAYYYYPGNDLNSNKIYCIIADYEGNKWIGTYNGIYRFKTSAFINYNTQHGISVPFIFGINETPNHEVWFGTQGGGIYNYNKGTFTNYTEADGLSSNTINCIVPYKNNKLIVGTSNGLTVIDNATHKVMAITNCAGLENKNISAITFGKDSNTYLASNNEIYINYELIENNPIPKNAITTTIFIDHKKRPWVTTFGGGIYCIEKGKLISKTKMFGNNCNSFFTVIEDEKSNMYFATLDGIFILNNKTQAISHITNKQGLISNLIYEFVYERKSNKLYIGSNKGLSCLDIGALNSTHTIAIDNYGYNEGFTLSECNNQSMIIDHRDNLWVGTVNGLVYFDRQYLKPNLHPAKINFTHFTVNDVDSNLTQNQKLDYDNNNITAYVDGICLTNALSVKYMYMLKGYEKKWSIPTSNNFIRYPKLPPGSYELLVKCANSSNVWNEPIGFKFKIKSPWYTHPIALLCYAILLGFAIYYVATWRINVIRNKEARKTMLAGYELKALRAQMNPHFIFNALNSIQHFVLNNDARAANKYLSKFAKLVRNILNNSERSEISLYEEMTQLELYLDLEKLRFEELFTYQITAETGINTNGVEIPTMLIQPYVENAILHGVGPLKVGGLIKIMFTMHAINMLKCTVTDNGVGREVAASLKKNSINKHQSAGTRITQNRLDLLNKINNTQLNAITADVVNQAGVVCGTSVELYIPLIQY
jgi:ligand-binding sensor domain-containing protein